MTYQLPDGYYVTGHEDCQSRQILVSPESVYSIVPERYLAKHLGERRVCSWRVADWPDHQELERVIERIARLDDVCRRSERVHEVKEARRMLAGMFTP